MLPVGPYQSLDGSVDYALEISVLTEEIQLPLLLAQDESCCDRTHVPVPSSAPFQFYPDLILPFCVPPCAGITDNPALIQVRWQVPSIPVCLIHLIFDILLSIIMVAYSL